MGRVIFPPSYHPDLPTNISYGIGFGFISHTRQAREVHLPLLHRGGDFFCVLLFVPASAAVAAESDAHQA